MSRVSFLPTSKKQVTAFNAMADPIDLTKLLQTSEDLSAELVTGTASDSTPVYPFFNYFYNTAETAYNESKITFSDFNDFLEEYARGYELDEDYLINVNIPTKPLTALTGSVRAKSIIVLNPVNVTLSPVFDDDRFAAPLISASELEVQTSATNALPIIRSYSGDAYLSSRDRWYVYNNSSGSRMYTSFQYGSNVSMNKKLPIIEIVFNNWVATNLTATHVATFGFNILIPKKYVKLEG